MKSKRTREYLTKPEMDRLLAASKDPDNTRNPVRDFAILLLMFRHGLRASELCSMKLSSVEVESKVIHVKRLKQHRRRKGSNPSESLVPQPLRTPSSEPHPLFNGEAQAIRAWLSARSEMNPESDALFVSERRQPLDRRTIWAMLDKLGKAAGLEKLAVHPHMLRHSCGYDLINKNTGLRVIQDYLGHQSISSTVFYTKLDNKKFANLF